MRVNKLKPSNRVIFPSQKWKNSIEIRFWLATKNVLDTFRISFGILELTLMTLLLVGYLGNSQNKGVSLVILGTVQDGGSPHIGCQKECCAVLFDQPDPTRKVVSLGVIDHEHQKTYVFDASPDFTSQLKIVQEHITPERKAPDGIFLTHAHIGHYTGLMYLGRESLGGKDVPVYALPKMKQFLQSNGPWSQLVSLKNIRLIEMLSDESIELTPKLSVVAFTVPHRDEFSETVGFKIIGPEKSVLFIPDIDKWGKWNTPIIEEIKKVDYAFLDATFFDGTEINNRDISEIPHPFVIESMELFKDLSEAEKSKIHFIHLNHTNPLLDLKSKAANEVRSKGFRIAQFKSSFKL